MADLSTLRPTQKRRVIDLVREAGVDVSDWDNFKAGPRPEKAATNPKYCYEWAFVQPDQVVVLNLWHDTLREDDDGRIWHEENFAANARSGRHSGKAQWRLRAERMDAAVRVAREKGLPVRVIVCDGDRRKFEDPELRASKVRARELDPVPWAVSSYDKSSGQCTLTRGAAPSIVVDQFHVEVELVEADPSRHSSISEVYDRDPKVRQKALARSNGRCEFCGDTGFKRPDGTSYLETHHVIPRSENGKDIVQNVAVLCPNHHREAHFGARAGEIREELLAKLKYLEQPPAGV